MIRQILAVSQGPNDLGFLQGLKDRLGCDAKLIASSELPILRQRGSITKRTDGRLIWDESRRLGADLIVRITDADDQPVRDVLRQECQKYPEEAHSVLLCGACDPDIEHWLSLDLDYTMEQLDFNDTDYPKQRHDRSGFIKQKLQNTRQDQESFSERVARFVREAPPETMRIWLDNASFSHFYDDCRRMAIQHSCEVRNERNKEDLP